MKTPPDEIFGFLNKNGVKRIRQVGDDFELLLNGDRTLSAMAFFHELAAKVHAKRPKMERVKSLELEEPRRWQVRLDAPRRHRTVLVYRCREDKDLDEKLKEELRSIEHSRNTMLGFLNRVRFNEETLPHGDLTSFLKGLPDHAKPQITGVTAYQALKALIENHFPKLPLNKSVPGTTKQKLRDLMHQEGHLISVDTLRNYLSRLGHTKTRD